MTYGLEVPNSTKNNPLPIKHLARLPSKAAGSLARNCTSRDKPVQVRTGEGEPFCEYFVN